MSLNDNKSGFGFDMSERLKKDRVKPTDTDAYADTDAPIKEKRDKKTYGLVRQSVFDKVSAYADAHGRSYNDIVCELLDEFIERNGL